MTKHVRFASTSTLYSISSPPQQLEELASSKRKPRPVSTPLFPTSTLPPEKESLKSEPSYASSGGSSSSSSSSSRSRRRTRSLEHPVPSQTIPSITTPINPEIVRNSLSLYLHYLVAFTPANNASVTHDLILPPSRIASRYSTSALMEPATNPKVQSLIITCPHLPWHVPVAPFHGGRYVTIMDVLTCLYYGLQTIVHRQEYDSLPTAEAKQQVDKAYFARCGRIQDPEDRHEEAMKGVKRIDFLMGRTTFSGLSGTKRNSNVWDLNVKS